MRSSTAPDSFIKQLLSNQELSTPAVHWGKCKEPVALQRYIDLQLTSGHNGLVPVKAGFVISEDFPFLGATPDACVHDPSRTDQYGLVEIKCPYKYRDMLPEQAALQSDFCSYIMVKEGKNILQLRRNHAYYSQVQGQMAITKQNWCVYTTKGIAVQTIEFDPFFWTIELLPKLVKFFDNCFAPAIVCPVHLLGMKAHNLSSE